MILFYSSYTLFWYQFQLEQAILDFAEGLRVIGVRPDEKLALFADNSSRWLIADQGVSIIFFSSTFTVVFRKELAVAQIFHAQTFEKKITMIKSQHS